MPADTSIVDFPKCIRDYAVELRGFEPLTPSLRTRCSARLSYSPLREREFYRSPHDQPDQASRQRE